jgi:fluoroquinolone resistance protein
MSDADYLRNAALRGNDYSGRRLPYPEYERCQFIDCTMAKADLRGVRFSDCKFVNCDLGMARLDEAALKGVQFTDCKLIGLDFGVVQPLLLEIGFSGCKLDYASFEGMKLKRTRWTGCSLVEANFVEADLTQAVFDGCDLHLASFARSILRSADLRTAQRYSIAPDNNVVRGARFSYPAVLGLLDRFGIEVE